MMSEFTFLQQGPPVSTVDGLCDDMVPQHGVPPQESQLPYSLTTTTECLEAGETISCKHNNLQLYLHKKKKNAGNHSVILYYTIVYYGKITSTKSYCKQVLHYWVLQYKNA